MIILMPTRCHTNYDYNMRLCHFDRRATKWPEVEKSIKKKNSRLRFAALEMTQKAHLLTQTDRFERVGICKFLFYRYLTKVVILSET